ncbi:predicted protein [Candida tropicalis MYA-3404]|uniref:Uncharacterized protein n=1 Tax=Candida tropicalis (strain ATCC MYA-3404 / T1) TaxID=294747 RepID=C5MCS2_CANTT|nr:predicted protein [Candida tropicalis MYA-3404]EER32352.1 predicted protein [Candida tropicalis MYA-3404]KAG4405960.1 hypothetical protein JTP64_004831 [Candida tropicalis]
MAQLTFLRASYTKIDHYQCHLMVFASNLGIVIVGVYSTMKCRLHPLSQVECCVSHLPCRINHVGCTMSRISCLIHHVASTMSHQPCRCYLRHVYPCDTYDRRHFKVYPTSDIFDRKKFDTPIMSEHTF